jgi:hypothetical protein
MAIAFRRWRFWLSYPVRERTSVMLKVVLYLVAIIWGGSLLVGLTMWFFMKFENSRRAKILSPDDDPAQTVFVRPVVD